VRLLLAEPDERYTAVRLCADLALPEDQIAGSQAALESEPG
jgi:hypothetical protein